MTHPGQPPNPPSDGYTVPHLRKARRIPEGLPFTVRPNRKRAIVITLVLAGMFGFPLSIGAIRSTIETDPSYGTTIAGCSILMGPILLGCAIILASMGFGGPLLACDDDGVWVRSRKFPVRAMFLPWSSVGMIYTSTMLLQPMVRVSSLDPHFRRTIATPTMTADTDSLTMLRALAHFSRGRCRVESVGPPPIR